MDSRRFQIAVRWKFKDFLQAIEFVNKLVEPAESAGNHPDIEICYKKDFLQAIEFVNKLVEPAESAGNHLDIEICYNKVKIVLTTHDAGRLTQKDFELAEVIYQIA